MHDSMVDVISVTAVPLGPGFEELDISAPRAWSLRLA